MNKLSVTVITLNEEENIKRCLSSFKEIADEIILVDSGSQDKTVEIAKKMGAHTFHRDFDNFANQKNFAQFKAGGEWVFSIDADEIVSPELATEIKEAIDKKEYQGFLVPRRNIILGGEIRHSRWSPDKHIWLWQRADGKWVGDVHEEVEVKGRIGELKNAKIHYQDKTIFEFISTNNHYSQLEAEKLFKMKVKFSYFEMSWETLFEFVIRYIYKLGFLDGWRGLVLAHLMAAYKLTVWLKLLELEKNRQKY